MDIYEMLMWTYFNKDKKKKYILHVVMLATELQNFSILWYFVAFKNISRTTFYNIFFAIHFKTKMKYMYIF